MVNYKKQVTIDALQEAADSNLFPDNEFDFWAGYTANASRFDRYFVNKFTGWKYYKYFDTDTSTADILSDFQNAIDAFLFINQKKYDELYRVQVLAANAYDIVNNYDLTETSTNTLIGSEDVTLGARTDSHTIGGKTDSISKSNSAYTDTTSETIGARTDTTSATLGSQTSNSESGLAGFNSSSYKPDSNGSITNGSRNDSSSASYGASTNSQSTNYGAHTDTESITEGSRSNSDVTGEQTNATSISNTNTTNLHRYGNIGVQTAAQIIGGHIELWNGFSFYTQILDDIAAEFLKVTGTFEISSVSSSGGGGGGSTDISAVLQAIATLSAKVDAQTVTITDNDDDNTATIRGDISSATTNINSGITGAKEEIISNDNTNTTNIRDDITDVTTNGY